MEFAFESRRPSALARYVESIWYARGRIDYPREWIAPTGSTVAVIVLGAPIREIPFDRAGEPFGLIRAAIRRSDSGQLDALKRLIESDRADV